MKTFLLLVTWLMHDQPPSNYQVAFNSLEACEAGRLKVINDAQRMRQDKIDQARALGGMMVMARELACARQFQPFVCLSKRLVRCRFR